MTTLKLQDLLQQSESAIAATSILLSQKIVNLDCTGVASLTPEQLTQLFSAIPKTWDFVELGEIFNSSTLSETFAIQLLEWINQNCGHTTNPPQPSTTNY